MRNARRVVAELRADRLLGTLEMSRWLRKSQDYVRQLAEAGILHYAKNADGEVVKGRFNCFDTVGDFIIYRESRAKADKPSSATEYENARTLRMQEQARTSQLRNEMMTGTVALLKDVDAAVIEAIVATKSKLLPLPAAILRLTEGMEDFHEKVKIGNQLMEDALTDLVPPDPDNIRSRNRKLAEYSNVLNEEDESTEDNLPTDEPKRGRGRPKKEVLV